MCCIGQHTAVDEGPQVRGKQRAAAFSSKRRSAARARARAPRAQLLQRIKYVLVDLLLMPPIDGCQDHFIVDSLHHMFHYWLLTHAPRCTSRLQSQSGSLSASSWSSSAACLSSDICTANRPSFFAPFYLRALYSF